MKKTILIIGLLGIAYTATYAQASKVMAAYNYLADYQTYKDGKDLVSAKEAIDAAAENETTSLQGKTWYYKGMVYYMMSKDSLLNKTSNTYLEEAQKGFEKALSIDDKKFKDRKEAVNYVKAISADVFNRGVDAYQNQDYEQAYNDFSAMKSLNKTLKDNNVEPVVPTEKVMLNIASAAEAGGMTKKAIIAYTEVLEVNDDVNTYRFLASLYTKEGNKEKAMETLDAAAKKYPENADVVIDQLNIFITDGKLDQAIGKIDKAIELQPDNDMLYFIKGNAYDKSGDMDNAIVQYEKAIKINPKNDKALYNAGAMYFLGANKYIEQMNALSYKQEKEYNELNEKRKGMYLKAKPYFEKVLEIAPEDDASKRALFKINSALETK